MIAALLHDPRLINFVLLALYAANAARWALHGSWPDSAYPQVTATVISSAPVQ